MSVRATAPARSPRPGGAIVFVGDEAELARIREPDVQAVIHLPTLLPAWFAELESAVRARSFVIPRVILHDVRIEEIRAWLEQHLPRGPVSPPVREALQEDLLRLVEHQRALTGAPRFIFRLLTEAPTQHCGFHLDTVAPGTPPWGLLRVYNGPGTRYVEPVNVTSTRDFYRHLSRRERLVRQLGEAAAAADEQAARELRREISALDEERGFLRSPDDVSVVPAGAIVAFKHLDAGLHWSDHPKGDAWIHCSPMEGEPRLLVNVTAIAKAGRRGSPTGRDGSGG